MNTDEQWPMAVIGGGLITLKDEGTQRYWTVQLRPFLLATLTVTHQQYELVVRNCPAPSGNRCLPVTDVSWHEAIQFCNAWSRQAGLAECYAVNANDEIECNWQANGYRLPTEAEWEFACRAGSNDSRYGELDTIAWYKDNSKGSVHHVGTKTPNRWGLHDMLGNVWEWCWDIYDREVYGPYRVFRGGGWSDPASACRASCRRKSHPTYKIDDLGFRVARSIG